MGKPNTEKSVAQRKAEVGDVIEDIDGRLAFVTSGGIFWLTPNVTCGGGEGQRLYNSPTVDGDTIDMPAGFEPFTGSIEVE